MNITFADRKLNKIVNDDRKMLKELGKIRAGKRNPVPTNAHGQYIWVEIRGVEVVEIINYHKEK